MFVRAVRFVSLMLTALTSGVVFSHVLKRRNKATLPAPAYLDAQQVLLRGWAKTAGQVESGALLSTAVGLILVRKRRPAVLLTAVGTGCLAAMIGVWAAWINPINKQVDAWTVESLPTDWKHVRDRWEQLHVARFGLSLIGLSALLLAVLSETSHTADEAR